ncbi:type III pantothenate kinase [Paracoccaceae bacterium GXU_MW_L88]
MLLAIDVGNTNSVFAIYDEAVKLAEFRISTSRERTADEYFTWLQQLLEHDGVLLDANRERVIDRVVIACVVPQVLFNLRVFSDRYFSARPLVVGKPEVKLPHPPKVDKDVVVGADRLANTAAAFDRFGGDCIVVDFGTATNFDVVDEGGAYIGGVISPGVNLSLGALHSRAAALPHIDVTRPEKVIGTNTLACMQSGIYWGYIGLVEGVCLRIQEERGRDMTVVATGGLSSLFAQGTDLLANTELDLTLHGLWLIAEYNK